MPYYGYARKDRKDEGRVPISAKVVANTLVGGGADRIVTVDMHAAQIQGFFDIPVDHLYAKPVLMRAVRALDIDDPVIVTPDVGGIKMARAYAKALGADLAIVDKRRISGSEIAVEHVIGEVEGRNVIIVDDMISTGGSISEAAHIVRKEGAGKIVARRQPRRLLRTGRRAPRRLSGRPHPGHRHHPAPRPRAAQPGGGLHRPAPGAGDPQHPSLRVRQLAVRRHPLRRHPPRPPAPTRP